jgi:glycerophosphoryl diester phosphodiesterase
MVTLAGRLVRRRFVLLGLAALIGAWYAVPWIRRIPADAPVAAIAHRGAPVGATAPEGTIEAFRDAIDAGADWLEFDVRTTRDGVLVVLHDDTVDRTTSGTGRIGDLSLEEVQALDAGGGTRVPTVREVVDLAKAADIPILPEIKGGPASPTAAEALVDLLLAVDYLESAVIQAFEAETLLAVRVRAPDARLCHLTGPGEFDIASPPAGAGCVCPMGEMILLHPDMVRQAHEAGLVVLAWWGFAESGPANAVLASYGVDGLILDDLQAFVRR